MTPNLVSGIGSFSVGSRGSSRSSRPSGPSAEAKRLASARAYLGLLNQLDEKDLLREQIKGAKQGRRLHRKDAKMDLREREQALVTGKKDSRLDRQGKKLTNSALEQQMQFAPEQHQSEMSRAEALIAQIKAGIDNTNAGTEATKQGTQFAAEDRPVQQEKQNIEMDIFRKNANNFDADRDRTVRGDEARIGLDEIRANQIQGDIDSQKVMDQLRQGLMQGNTLEGASATAVTPEQLAELEALGVTPEQMKLLRAAAGQ